MFIRNITDQFRKQVFQVCHFLTIFYILGRKHTCHMGSPSCSVYATNCFAYRLCWVVYRLNCILVYKVFLIVSKSFCIFSLSTVRNTIQGVSYDNQFTYTSTCKLPNTLPQLAYIPAKVSYRFLNFINKSANDLYIDDQTPNNRRIGQWSP